MSLHTTSRTLILGLGAALLLTATACGGESPARVADGGTPTSPSSPTSTASSPSASATPSVTPSVTAAPTPSATESAPDQAPKLIAYAGGEASGALIRTQADANDLRGTPRAFRTFIGTTAEDVVAGASCDEPEVGVNLEAVRVDGYAIGGVNECGGYRAIWADVDGGWQQIAGTQDAWDCAILKRYEVPSELLLGNETCFDYDGDQQEHDYHQA